MSKISVELLLIFFKKENLFVLLRPCHLKKSLDSKHIKKLNSFFVGRLRFDLTCSDEDIHTRSWSRIWSAECSGTEHAHHAVQPLRLSHPKLSVNLIKSVSCTSSFAGPWQPIFHSLSLELCPFHSHSIYPFTWSSSQSVLLSKSI